MKWLLYKKFRFVKKFYLLLFILLSLSITTVVMRTVKFNYVNRASEIENPLVTEIKTLNKQIAKTQKGTLGSKVSKKQTRNKKQDSKNKEAELTNLLQNRKISLLKLIETDPLKVKELLTLTNLDNSTNPELVERIVNADNVSLQIFVADDFENKISTTEAKIIIDNKSYSLISPETESLNPGKISIQGGIVFDSYIFLTPENVTVTTTKQPLPKVEKVKLSVILFNFQNDTSMPYSLSDMTKVMQNSGEWWPSVRDLYLQSSYDSITYESAVYGWYTIPYDNTNCDQMYHEWAQAADKKAEEAGVDLTNTGRAVYVFPAHCPWGGISEMYGSEVYVTALWQLP